MPQPAFTAIIIAAMSHLTKSSDYCNLHHLARPMIGAGKECISDTRTRHLQVRGRKLCLQLPHRLPLHLQPPVGLFVAQRQRR